MHLPQSGDAFDLWRVDGVDAGMSGDSVLWDFSDVRVLDENYPVRYIGIGDSLLLRMESNGQYYYLLSGDSLFSLGYESAKLRVKDSIPQLTMRYPMCYGDSIASPFYFKGNYCGSNALALRGIHKVVADGRGTLILPDDTVHGVLRVRSESSSLVRVSRSLSAAPISDDDALMRKVVTSWRWYSTDCRYPLAESIRTVYYDTQNRKAKECEVSYIFTPSVQDYTLKSTIQRILANKNINGNSADNRHLTDLGSGSAEGGMTNLSASYTGAAVAVDYDISVESALAEVVLADLQGRVYGVISQRNAKPGHQSELLPCGILPTGDYLLSVSVNGERSTRLIRVR